MQQFNIRVYGLFINDHNEIMVSDEWIKGNKITKFPGGGLEIGEGTRECLLREFLEEMDLKIAVGDHFYTTDFYQKSAFNPEHQIISIYYKVKALEPLKVDLKKQPFDFDAAALLKYEAMQQIEVFRFIPLSILQVNDLTLPIDRVVVEKLLATSFP
jgi:8-oxo-dGTP diphosphatase